MTEQSMNASAGKSPASSPSAEIRAHLERAGVEGLPRKWFQAAEAPIAEQTPPGTAPLVTPSAEEIADVSTLDFDTLERVALGCTKCRLCEGRTKVVFGDGARERPLIMFIGEGPGAEEDKRGIPFVGRAGELLTAAITKGMGLRREDVYIANVVKCRPPQNRAPLPDEVKACTPYLYRQLDLLQPKVIVTLGQPAQLAITNIDRGITKVRGQWQTFRGYKVMPTLHPAYLLRNPAAKKDFWSDLQLVMDELGLKKP